MKSSLNSILSFFLLLIIQIFGLASLLIICFNISINDVLAQKNIPELAKNIYLVALYSFLLLNLFFFDKNNFTNVFKISKKRITYFLKGLIISILSMFCLFSIECTFSFIGIRELSINIVLLLQVIFFSFFIALVEELLFRNFIFRRLREQYKLNTALIISAYIYAQLHFLRFDLSFGKIILPLSGLFIIGLILAYIFHKFDFWYNMGMHMGWIIIISYTTQSQIFIIKDEYFLLTGGYYPLAGIFGNIMALVLLILILKKTINNQILSEGVK